jgi:hypothetical protein
MTVKTNMPNSLEFRNLCRDASEGKAVRPSPGMNASPLVPERAPDFTRTHSIPGESVCEYFLRHIYNNQGDFSYRITMRGETGGDRHLADIQVRIPERMDGGTISIQFKFPKELSANDKMRLDFVMDDGTKISVSAYEIAPEAGFFKFKLPEQFLSALDKNMDGRYGQGDSSRFEVLRCNFILEHNE